MLLGVKTFAFALTRAGMQFGRAPLLAPACSQRPNLNFAKWTKFAVVGRGRGQRGETRGLARRSVGWVDQIDRDGNILGIVLKGFFIAKYAYIETAISPSCCTVCFVFPSLFCGSLGLRISRVREGNVVTRQGETFRMKRGGRVEWRAAGQL